MSKWQGQSEKAVKILFQRAKKCKPSVVFFDEIDSLCCKRKEDESESARRIKNEFLVQINDIDSGVFFLCASNIPWELDAAFLRRMNNRIHIPLPELEVRANILKTHMKANSHTITDDQFYEIAKKLEGYSASDISNIVRDALLEPIRRLKVSQYFKITSDKKYMACNENDENAIKMNWTKIPKNKMTDSPITLNDFNSVLPRCKSSINKSDLGKYKEFTNSTGFNA